MTHAVDLELRNYLSTASFWRPDRIVPPHAWIEHIPFAFWLVGALQPRTIVELGTHTGNSFFTFCQAAARHELATQLTAIDTWQGDEHAGTYAEDVYIDVSRHRDAHFPQTATLLRSTFEAARPSFAAGSVDLLHIDGLHTYEAVRHDFETWREAVSDRGVVLFHDTAVRERGFGVWQLWAELAPRYPSFEFTHGNGLGVLAVGPAVPEPVQALFRPPENAADTLRMVYHRLGQSVVDQEPQVSDLRRQLMLIHTSRSWKVAATLSRLADFLRGR